MRRLLKESQNTFNPSVHNRKKQVLQENKPRQVIFGKHGKSRTSLAVSVDEADNAYKNSTRGGNENLTSQFHELASVDSYCSTFRTRSREGLRNDSDKRQLNKEAAAQIMKTMPKTVQDILTKIIQQTNKSEGEQEQVKGNSKRNELPHNASQDSSIHREATKNRSLTLQSTNQRSNTSISSNLKTISRERNGNSMHCQSSSSVNPKTPYLQILQNMMHISKVSNPRKQQNCSKGRLKTSSEASSAENNNFLNNCSISSCSEREDTYFQDFSFEVSAKKKKKESPFGLLQDLNTSQIEVRSRQKNQENTHALNQQLKAQGSQYIQKNLLAGSIGSSVHLCADKENINNDGIFKTYQSERCNTDCSSSSSMRQSKQLFQSRTILSSRRQQSDKRCIASDIRHPDRLGISKRELLGDCRSSIPNSVGESTSSVSLVLPKMALLRDTKKGVIEKQVVSQNNQSIALTNPVGAERDSLHGEQTNQSISSKLRSSSSLSVDHGEYSKTTPYGYQNKQLNKVQSSKERTLQMLINQLKPTDNSNKTGETKGEFFEGLNQQKQNFKQQQEIIPVMKPNNQKQEMIKDIIKGMSQNAQQVLQQIMNRGQPTVDNGKMNSRQNNSKIYCKTENDFSFEDSGEVPFRFFNEEKESEAYVSLSGNQENEYGFVVQKHQLEEEKKYPQLKQEFTYGREKSKSYYEGGDMIRENVEIPWNGQVDRENQENSQERRSFSVCSTDNGRDSCKSSQTRKQEMQSSSYAEQRRNRQNYIKGSYSTKSRPQSSLAQLAARISSKNLNANQSQTIESNSMQRNFKSTDLGEEIQTNRLTQEEIYKLEALARQKLDEIQRKNIGGEAKRTLKQSSSLPFQKGILGGYLENKITTNCTSNNHPILAVKPQIMIHPPVPKSFQQPITIATTTATVQNDNKKQQKINNLQQGNDVSKTNTIPENNEKASSEVESHLDFSYNSTDIGSNIGSSYLGRKHGQQPYLFSSQKNSLSFEADKQLRLQKFNETLRSTQRQQQQQSQEQLSASSEEKEQSLKNKQLLLPCRSQSSSHESKKEEEERARKVEDLQLTVSEKEAEIMQLRLQVQDLQVVLDLQKFQPSSRCDNLEEKILCSRFNLASSEPTEQKFSSLNPKDKIKAVRLQLDSAESKRNHSENSSENGGQSDSSRLKCNASEIDLSDQIRSLAIAKNLQFSCSSTQRS